MKIICRSREAFRLESSTCDLLKHQKKQQFRLSDTRVLLHLPVILMLSILLSARELCAALLTNQTAISFVHLEVAFSDPRIEETVSSSCHFLGLFDQSRLESNPRLIWYRGVFELLVLRDAEAARQYFVRYMRGRHHDAITQFWLAEAYEQLGDHAQAVVWWREAGAGLGFYERGYRLEQSGNLADAESMYLTATEIDPSLAIAYTGLARITEAQGRWEDAVRYYQEATRLHPSNPSLYYARARVIAWELHQPDRAVSVFRDGIDANPGYLWNYMGLGHLYREILHKYDDARHWYLQAESCSPTSELPQIGLGLNCVYQQDLDCALEHFEIAFQRNPYRYGTHYQLARIYFRQGSIQQAIGEYRETIDLASDFLPAYIELSEIYASQERWDDACSLVRQALAIDPSNSDAVNRLTTLQCPDE